MPPVAETVWLYGAATCPPVSAPGDSVTGTSSLVMAMNAVGMAIVALTALNRPSEKASFVSGTVSPTTGIAIVRLVCPGVKVSVPDTAP